LRRSGSIPIFFTRGHRRDHRKIIVIDDRIAYLGSMNITGYNLNWRELALRIDGEMASIFKTCFQQNFEAFNPITFPTRSPISRTLKFGDFELVRDVPSIPLQRLKKNMSS